MSFFSRMGTDQVPYSLTITQLQLELHDSVSVKQFKNTQLQCQVVRGTHTVSTDTVIGSSGVYEYNSAQLKLSATLYRKKNKFLSKTCTINILNKSKIVGSSEFELCDYVDTNKAVNKMVKVDIKQLGGTVTFNLHTIPTHEIDTEHSAENSVNQRVQASTSKQTKQSTKENNKKQVNDDSDDNESDTEAAIDRFRKKPAATTSAATTTKPTVNRDIDSDDSSDEETPVKNNKPVKADVERNRALQDTTNKSTTPAKSNKTAKPTTKPVDSDSDTDDSSDDDVPAKPQVKPTVNKTITPAKSAIKSVDSSSYDSDDDEPSKRVKFGQNQTKTITKQSIDTDDSSDEDTPVKHVVTKQISVDNKAKRIISFNDTLDNIYTSQHAFNVTGDIPMIVSTLIQYIQMHNGARTEGIFRISASTGQRDAIVKQLNSGNYKLTTNDVLLIGSVLKYWFSTLSESILPNTVYAQCIQFGKQLYPDDVESDSDNETDLTGTHDKLNINDTAAIRTKLYEICKNIPVLNKRVLYAVIQLLQQISAPENVSYSKMTVTNLATVFAPNWLRSDKSQKPSVQYQEVKYSIKCIECMIQYGDVLDASINNKPLAVQRQTSVPSTNGTKSTSAVLSKTVVAAPVVDDSDDSEDEHESALPPVNNVPVKTTTQPTAKPAPKIVDSDDTDDSDDEPTVQTNKPTVQPSKPAPPKPAPQPPVNKTVVSKPTPVIDSSDDSSDDEPPVKPTTKPPVQPTKQPAPPVKVPVIESDDSETDSDTDTVPSNNKTTVIVTPPTTQPSNNTVQSKKSAAPVIHNSDTDSDSDTEPVQVNKKQGSQLVNGIKVLPDTVNEEQYKQRISSLEQQLADLQQQSNTLKSKPAPPIQPPTASVNKQIIQLNERVDTLTQENIQLQEQIQRATTELKLQINNNTELQQQYKQATDDIKQLTAHNKELTELKQVQQKQKQMESIPIVDTTVHERKINELQLQITDLSDKNLYYKDLCTSYKTVIDTLNNEIVTLQTSSKKVEYFNNELLQKSLKKNKNVELQDAYNTLKVAYDTVQSTLQDTEIILTHSKQGWTSVNTVLQQQVDALEIKYNALEKQLQAILNDTNIDVRSVVVLQQSNDKLQQLNKRYKDKIDRLEQTDNKSNKL